ncbi:MAG TPA: AMP-binding protein [Bryobacteraceae bacterium]|nr:AMP-binding protein [Bryobacteraceae bacterium]
MSGVAWAPDSTTRERAQLTRFLRQIGSGSFHDLYAHSVADIPGFTADVLRFLEVQFDKPYDRVLDLSRGIEWPQWCAGAKLNIAKTCLRHDSSRTAVIWEGEEGGVRTLTYGELASQAGRCAAALSRLGLRAGDAVGIHLPMSPEAVVVLLALAHAGLVAVPLFSGYGPAAIESRMRDVNARVLFTCDYFPRRGNRVNARATAEEAAARCPALERVIVLPRGGGLSDFLTDVEPAAPAATGAEDPLIVLYTSGTTGRPKGILHTHCGFPVKSAQDMAFGTDVGRGTRIAWITDIGWMMGPWLIYGASILGGTLCLYDGAPDFPGPDRLWAFCARHRVEVLGISPTLIRAMLLHGDELPGRQDLSSLRIFGSTGEPWNPDPWWWLFERVGRRRVPIINYSGGTEISGGILMGNPLMPVKPCAFAAPCPGIAADVVDDRCRPVRGSVGELVIRAPWIGMARGFLNDPQRYLATYWSRWPGVWAHGDWARIDEDGHWYILGRSDDTLKIGGKRVGPAEVESILVAHDAVAEAAAIAAPHEQKGGSLIAFCVLTAGYEPSDGLASDLANRVAVELGKPLRPDRIVFVPALPKTRNAKVMRRVIRSAYVGEDLGDLSALENPAAIEAILTAAAARAPSA